MRQLVGVFGKDAICAVDFGNNATVTSYGIRNPRVWQKCPVLKAR
jgi:hypothetical protein